MKNIILTSIALLSFTFSYAQYSDYYITGDIDVSSNINVSGDIDVNVEKTIKTIDYGALAQANAIRERNKINLIKFESEQLRRQAIEISNNPLKAYDYGTQGQFAFQSKEARDQYEVKRNWVTKYITPKLLFERNGNNYNEIVNYSENGITTTITFTGPIKRKVGVILEEGEINLSLEDIAKNEVKVVGTLVNYSSDDYKQFLHEKEVNRIDVYGKSGYSSKLVLEDDYQIQITENYASENWLEGYISYVFVTYKGNKREVSFEELEGRRFYLKRLIDKVIASAYTQKGWN